jgi:hypothetical protein
MFDFISPFIMLFVLRVNRTNILKIKHRPQGEGGAQRTVNIFYNKSQTLASSPGFLFPDPWKQASNCTYTVRLITPIILQIRTNRLQKARSSRQTPRRVRRVVLSGTPAPVNANRPRKRRRSSLITFTGQVRRISADSLSAF